MNRLRVLLLVSGFGWFATGCTPAYTIHAPQTSGLRYQAPVGAADVTLNDGRGRALFSDGRPMVAITFEGAPGELAYLQTHVLAELRARGVVVSSADPASTLIAGRVREFGVRSQRVSGFSPMVTFTRFSADFVRGSETVRIAAYSKQAKTPKWTMGELSEPCYNRPLQIVVGEVAAKINRHFLGARISDAALATLVQRSQGERGAALLSSVNELGWSNHPGALPTLTMLAASDNEEVRGVALGAIGTLGVPSSLAQLKRDAEDGPSHTDRYMALKAIGDLATDEALAYLRARASALPDTAEGVALREIITLYLHDRPSPPVAGTAPAEPLALQARQGGV